MRKIIAGALAVWICLFATITMVSAQEPVDKDINAKIREEGLKRSKVYEVFTHFTEVIGPRLTASPAYKTAAEYAKDKLIESGLKNAHLESWDFGRGWTLDKLTVEMVEPRYMPLIGYAEAWTGSTPGEIVAAPLFLGGKTPEEIEKVRDKIKGSIVMAQPIMTSFIREDRPQPTTSDRPVRIGAPANPANQAARANAQAL